MNSTIAHRVELRPPQIIARTALRVWPAEGARRQTALLLAPAAGSNLNERVLSILARGLSERGVAVGTFDFAYRQAKRRLPDPRERLERAFADVLSAFADLVPARHYVLGGRSMGGRIASHLAAAESPGRGRAPASRREGIPGRGRAPASRREGIPGRGQAGSIQAAGVLALAYPLHPRSRPDPRRTAHWPDITVPVLFVHGDRDPLCPVDALEAARRMQLRNAASAVHVIAGADHGFAAPVRDRRAASDVNAELIATVDAWLTRTFEEEDEHG